MPTCDVPSDPSPLRGSGVRTAQMLVLTCVAALAGGCGPARSPYALDYAAPAKIDLPTERYRLDNGLEVMLSADHTVPFVAVDLWVHAGSKDDPPGRAGFAHLFEHLMFDGSRHVAAGEHFEKLQAAGARDVNAYTNLDRTAFHETVPPGSLDLALWLESDRFAFFAEHLDQETFDRERRVVENELRQTDENQPYGMVEAAVWAALFPEPHPYHHLTIGNAAELDRASLEEVRAFFRTWYVPPNATLALVGDFDVARTRELIDRYFGPIASGAPLPQRPDTLASRLASERRQLMEADVPRARVVVAWPVVPEFADGSIEIELGTGPLGGYMYRGLVQELRIATSLHSSIELGHLASALEVTMDAEPGVPPERVLEAFDEKMHHIRAEHSRYNRAEFAVGRARELAERLYSAERYSSRAELLQLYNEEAGEPDYANKELERRQGVSVEDVRKAYYDMLRWDRRVVTIVVPRAGAPRCGRLVGPT